MKIIALDFETYYDKEYSLSKVTTEEYIRDERFETIGVGVKEDGQDAVWVAGTHDKIKKYLDSLNLHEHLVLAHNAIFDAAILNWRFDIRPRGWLDTLSMARALHTVEVGGSLSALAAYYKLGEKGTEVIQALGKRRTDFTAVDLAAYGEYCKNDCHLTLELFKILSQGFNKDELKLIDLTIRMFSEPVLALDVNILLDHIHEVQVEKEKLLKAVTMVDKDQLMSNDKFAGALKAISVAPPTKISPTTGKVVYALAKTDEGMKALLEHENPKVQALAAARLGVKSTLEETRTQRFIEIAGRGTLPIPLRYYAAHTGRWGGDDKVNMQNLPRDSPLKDAILAPAGYMMIDADSSQIEARTLAWLAEQNDLVEAFDRGEDVYKKMASAIYNKPESDITKEERFVGKTTILGCFGADTLVLTNHGWKRIVEVQATDMLWDGEEWVKHQGVIPQGVKQTIRGLGVDATPDHEILTEHGWQEWSEVITNPSLTQSALNRGTLPSQTGGNTLGQQGGLLGGTLSCAAHVDGKGRLIAITSKQGELLDATPAQKTRLTKLVSIIGGTKVSFLTKPIAHVYSIVSQAVSQGVTDLLVKRIPIMGGGVSLSTNLGVQIEPRSYATLYHSLDGTMPAVTSTVSTTAEGTNPETYDLQPDQKTQKTNEPPELCKQKLMTYDIAYAGPRNRYTIATTAGALTVHNCGYGMGALKFQAALRNAKPKPVFIELEEAKHIIETYRRTYPMIPAFWKKAGDALGTIMGNQAGELGRDGILKIDGLQGILLPNGMRVKYPHLRKVINDDGKTEMVYDTKRGKATIPNRIYGGKVTENVCQALARIAIGKQMLMIAKKYKVVMTVHDSVVTIVPEGEVETAQEFIELCMRLRPEWAPDLPLNCEAFSGKSYGG